MSRQSTKDKFIESLVKYGFTAKAMRDTSIDLGLDPEYHKILFPDGVAEVSSIYEQMLDGKMLEILAKIPRPERVRERVAFALKVRIIKLGTTTPPKCTSQSIWRTSDAIWRYTGDTSTDFNHYTKRGLLSAVYVASRRYYARDTSEKFVNTEKFISKSIDRVLKVASLKHKLPKMEDIPILRLFS